MIVKKWDVLWLTWLILYILVGTALVPFHGDESTVIYMGRDYYHQFIERDLSKVLYTDRPEAISPTAATEQHLRLLNGTIPKYLYGFVASLRGYSILEINDQWVWGAGWNYNLEEGHIPSEGLLLQSRLISTGMLAAGCVVLFMIAALVGGRWAAYLASLYYALNPALLINGRRAMMEGTMIFTGLLVVLAGIYALEKRTWRSFLLLGVSVGIAIASKHTNVFVVAAVMGIIGARLFYDLMRDFSRRQWKPLAGVVVAGIAGLLVFYAFNPAWWGDPFNRALTVLDLRTELLSGQVETFGGYDSLLEQTAGFLRQTLLVQAMYYEVDVWADYIGDQITAYEATLLDGIPIGGGLVGGVVVALLMIAGLVSLYINRDVSSNSRLLVGGWSLAMLAMTWLLTPLEWQRYYLPAYPAVGLLLALGMGMLWKHLPLNRINR